MKSEEVIEMARQAGCFEKHQVFYFTSPELEAFAKLVAAKEREACAKLVEVSDDLADWEIICGGDGRVLLNEMAKAIRARGGA